MKDYLVNNTYCNVAKLKFYSANTDQHHEARLSTAVSKLMQCASVLSEGQYIGMQFSLSREGECTCYVFSDETAAVGQKDFEWAFDGFANILMLSDDAPQDIFKYKNVYALRESGGKKSEFEPISVTTVCWETAQMLQETGAEIRLILCSTGTGEVAMGTVYIGIHTDMPVRMRATLSSLFSYYEFIKAQQTFEPVPVGTCTRNLIMMCDMRAQREYVDKGLEELSNMLSGETTPIETLDFSVRAFNCLKRAGILSVEELQRMTDEDFMHVRNLGRKSLDEIKEKLAGSAAKKAEEDEAKDVDYSAELDALIGLDNVKKQVRRIAAYARMKKAMEAAGNHAAPIALNMCFLGNPGTAKTTVARILAGIFWQVGLLESPKVIEVGRGDLIGEYVGKTAIKVQSVFEEAKGKMLFIDEAYSLVDDRRGSFGDEAISTIIQEMENHRRDTVVVFAGYPGMMDDLLSVNPGLRSRIPFKVEFGDYSVEELVSITAMQCLEMGFTLQDDSMQKVRDICEKACTKPDFGNGRFCRNLAENAVISYALRIFDGENESPELDYVLNAEDFSEEDIFSTPSSVKQPIGF